jgi:hypothetical protein
MPVLSGLPAQRRRRSGCQFGLDRGLVLTAAQAARLEPQHRQRGQGEDRMAPAR